jgi:hypothetical protein
MRVRTIKLIPGVLATLGLALSSSAQSEIDPDHFEMTHVEPLPQPARTVAAGRETQEASRAASPCVSRWNAQGRLWSRETTPCSSDSSGRGDMVTLRPKAGPGGVRARVLVPFGR